MTTPPGPSCEKAMDRSASKHKSDDIRRDIRFTHFTHLYGFTGSPFFHKVDARHLSNQTSEVFFRLEADSKDGRLSMPEGTVKSGGHLRSPKL